MTIIQRSGHLRHILSGYNDFSKTVKRITQNLRKNKVPEFSHYAVRGISGAVAGGAASLRHKKGLIVVRKPHALSHKDYDVEGLPGGNIKYLILDDFISTGQTCVEIIKGIRKYNEFAECIGFLSYNYKYFYSLEFLKREYKIIRDA